MKENLKRILNPETGLRERLFQLLSTIALAEFVLVSIYTILFGGSAGHIALMLLGTAVFAATVALTFRAGKIRVGSAVSGFLYFLLYPLTFFSSGGMYGGAPVVFAFALVYVFVATEGWWRAALMALCVAITGACYGLSCLHPELLVRHTALAEQVESFLSILLVTLLLCMLFAFVTEVYRAENRIVQRQKREIEELNQAQKHFFSSMSHEIRTPVNAIIGLNEMTLKSEASGEVRENAQNIEVAGKILLHTINEILDLSRLETGTMEILPAKYRITAMLSDIVSVVWLRAQEKGLDFRIEVDPDLPTALIGDETRIRQILLNVITNAVKYTKKGSVTLSITGNVGGDGVCRVRYDVADTGIGIRGEDIPHLFTAFQRVDEQKTHHIEGTGLGLAIVRQLLDMMGGSVAVESEYGKGTTFRIEIPQPVADAHPVGAVDLGKRAQAPEAERQAAFVAPSAKVLAVDDTPMNLMVVKKLLRDTKVTVDTAASGAEALEKTLATRYDIILMDHQMPEMDGIECLHRIKAQEGGLCRDSRIVCLTANVGAEMERLCREEGFDGYLVKPVRGKTLEEELARLIPGV